MVVDVRGRSRNHPGESAFAKLAPAAPHGSTGFLITDLSFKPVYANGAAIQILTYPKESDGLANSATLVQQRIHSVVQTEGYTAKLQAPMPFLSGKRHYVCRPFFLGSWCGKTPKSTVGLLLERYPREPVDISEACSRFHFSPRERETVQHLIHGLTTKEVAQRMNISPNTVKQFIRLVMSKTVVTTRSGLIRKILFS